MDNMQQDTMIITIVALVINCFTVFAIHIDDDLTEEQRAYLIWLLLINILFTVVEYIAFSISVKAWTKSHATASNW